MLVVVPEIGFTRTIPVGITGVVERIPTVRDQGRAVAVEGEARRVDERCGRRAVVVGDDDLLAACRESRAPDGRWPHP